MRHCDDKARLLRPAALMDAGDKVRDEPMHVRVDCHAGLRGAPEPAAFWLGGRCVVVHAVVDRWYSKSQRWFKVETGDGDIYILRHDEPCETWALAAFTSAKSPGTHPTFVISGTSNPH